MVLFNDWADIRRSALSVFLLQCVDTFSGDQISEPSKLTFQTLVYLCRIMITACLNLRNNIYDWNFSIVSSSHLWEIHGCENDTTLEPSLRPSAFIIEILSEEPLERVYKHWLVLHQPYEIVTLRFFLKFRQSSCPHLHILSIDSSCLPQAVEIFLIQLMLAQQPRCSIFCISLVTYCITLGLHEASWLRYSKYSLKLCRVFE